MGAGSITANAEVRRTLKARTEALTQFVIGLSHYGGREYGEALAAFREADSPDWRDEDGKEILYLFIGNAAAKTGDLAEAGVNYQRALELSDHAFARAHVGMGENVRALSGCGAEADPAAINVAVLDEAYHWYVSAESAAFRPAVSQIDAKAAYGKGRIHVCRSLTGADEWGRAEEEYRKVVSEYAPPGSDEMNTGVQRLAAEAHMGLGLVLVHTASETDPGPDYRQAVAEYEAARELHEDEDRLALIHGWLGWLHSSLGESAMAEQECATARDLGLDPLLGLCA